MAENWFSLIQTLGIVVSFAIAARSLSIDARTRTTEIHLSLTAAHRDIWENLLTTPSLADAISPTRNLEASPVTPEEERFVLSGVDPHGISPPGRFPWSLPLLGRP